MDTLSEGPEGFYNSYLDLASFRFCSRALRASSAFFSPGPYPRSSKNRATLPYSTQTTACNLKSLPYYHILPANLPLLKRARQDSNLRPAD